MSVDSNSAFSSQPPTNPSEVIDVQIVDMDTIPPESVSSSSVEDGEELDDLWEDTIPEVQSMTETSEELMEDTETLGLVEEMIQDESKESTGILEVEGNRDPIAETIPQSISSEDQVLLNLPNEVKILQEEYDRLQQQIAIAQSSFNSLIQNSLSDLEQRKQSLEINIAQLERRRDRLKEEMGRSFAGSSQDMAIRLQGFKDYLVGSLQDLVVIVEDMQVPTPPPTPPQPTVIASPSPVSESRNPKQPQFTEPAFKATQKRIKDLLDQYRTTPDYYGPPWQIRRTVEPIHIDRIQTWFFKQSGRGSLKSLGSRLQNILVTATVISILTDFYGDRLQTLILANMPERLGEWRRGLQDCLGLSRGDFGPDGGIMLFEDPEAVTQRADRLISNQEMPLIIVDNSDNQISLSLLQFPLWLAFASEPQQIPNDFRY